MHICGRSLRGSVDWNKIFPIIDALFSVAPFAGAWIEIPEPYHWFRKVSVAPFAGAWIEMSNLEQELLEVRSLPSRELGLKLAKVKIMEYPAVSLPSRERGLKFFLSWNRSYPFSRSLRGSVDWNYEFFISWKTSICRSLRGSVDWNHISME